MSTATAHLPPIGRAQSPVGLPATRAWLSLDLDGLAETLAGRRRLPVGRAHFVGHAEAEDRASVASPTSPMPRPRLDRVPQEAFVSIRRPVAAADAVPAKTAPEPAPAERVIPLLQRARRAAEPRLPRRHKLMLAVAAAVMAFGLLQAGAERLHHGDTRTLAVFVG